MSMYDLILKKREGGELSTEEIDFLVQGTVDGSIPDYQLSALLMAIYFRGMTAKETAELTLAMANSGDTADLSAIEGFKADKHSTGGVGDKTTLIIAPIVASLGVKVAKMSGRGLGHTGGTVDKMESIPGMQTSLSADAFIAAVRKAGLAVVGQSGSFAPADKRLYALRDVTATVDSIPLIAASIMSKKLAAGSDGIVLDVKTGSGAFMKDLEASVKLAEAMVSIGEHAGKPTIGVITDMDIPLGRYIGNALEVEEAISVLSGKGEQDLREVCIELAAAMLMLAGLGDVEHCKLLVTRQLQNGEALLKLRDMVEVQGGAGNYITQPALFQKASIAHSILSKTSGYIAHMDTAAIGRVATHLGAGRQVKEDVLDFTAGIYLSKKTGEFVKAGDELAILFTNKSAAVEEAEDLYLQALTFSDTVPPERKLILARVDREGSHYYS